MGKVTILRLEWRDAESLLANPWNFRVHPKEQREVIRESINLNGWVEPLVENEVTGHLLNGHMRAEEALDGDFGPIPVIVVECAEVDEPRVLAMLDPVGAMAKTDRGALLQLIEDLRFQRTETLQAVLDNLLADSSPTVQPESKEETIRVQRLRLAGEARRVARHIRAEMVRRRKEEVDTRDLEASLERAEALVLELEKFGS